MEVAAFIIGTSGLISVAQTCLQVARAIDGVKTFREESASLYAEYSFEQVRLTLWISHVLGVTYSPLAIETLQLGDEQLPSMLTLVEKYGATTGTGATASATDKDVSFVRRAMFQTKIYKDGGADEIQKLLVRFKDWNDRLDGIVESRMRHHLVSNMHVRLLSSAVTDQQLEVIQHAAQGPHPTLSEEAAFRRGLLSIEQRPGGRVSNLRVRPGDISPNSPPVNNGWNLRKMGIIKSNPAVRVLQEWKLGQPNWGQDEISTVVSRADRLASMLCLENKPSRLRCLDLVAYAISDGGEGERTRIEFCFLYRPPPFANSASDPLTLQAALMLSERRRPTLPQRFNMATMLAESVLEFHVSQWLHKAVCSSNVLFFSNNQTDQPDFSAPFMAGFEFSRPDTVKDMTLETCSSVDFDVYCHPELIRVLTEEGASGRPRHQRQYDIYGLGVVLLEIGCWLPLKPILESRKARGRTRHEELLLVCTTLLPSRMGTKYKDAVYACLTWPPDDEKTGSATAVSGDAGSCRRSQIEEFAYTVANVLSECHCLL
ncbi:putative Ankyrin repeat and kinase domain containing 1 [Ilyonectria robusta]